MAEWSIAAVLKTVELRGSGGSNPSFSAESSKKLLFMFSGGWLLPDLHDFNRKRRGARVVEEARLESV